MKSPKILSVIIPSYNTELYLTRCLNSLLYNKEVTDKLEIIIVNDGSTDNTLNIAKNYRKQYPGIIKVIDKPNGGHGSAVNAGVKVATGKYVRIVDSDDWVNIRDFAIFIKKLQKEDTDIIITNYLRDTLYDESIYRFIFTEKSDSQPHNINNAAKIVHEKDFFFRFSMHSMTVKLDTLKKVWGNGLLEKTFYVDQQFVAYVLMSSHNYVEYNLDIYRYFVGRPEQSVSSDGFFNHRQDHERVLRWLLKARENSTEPHIKTIFTEQIKLMLNTHYSLYLKRKNLSKDAKAELMAFNQYLSQEYPDMYCLAEHTKSLNTKLLIQNTPLRKITKVISKKGVKNEKE